MENDELIKIWKSMDGDSHKRSREELDELLSSRAKQTINRYIAFIAFSVLVSIGFMVYLIVTTVNRQDDQIYLVNNLALGVITMISLVSGVNSWYAIRVKQYDLSLENWLMLRINTLSNWLEGKFSKLYLFLIPLLCLMSMLSIHVYFEGKAFVEVLHNEESIIGLMVGAPIGIFVAYYSVIKVRKLQLHDLRFLKELHERLVGTIEP